MGFLPCRYNGWKWYCYAPCTQWQTFSRNFNGKNIVNYDSMIVLTHFKGHAMGGYGGFMKNIAIGCADGRIGKSMVHGVSVDNQPTDWGQWPSKERLMENMAESAKLLLITLVNISFY